MSKSLRPSIVYSPFAISAALAEGSRHVFPSGSEWQGPSDLNRQFIERYYPIAAYALSQNQVPEVKGKGAKGTVDPVNDFLRENNFTIQLRGPIGPRDLALAAIMKIAMQWHMPGTSEKLHRKTTGQEYPAVKMKDEVGGFWFIRNRRWPDPILEIRTNGEKNTRFFMTMVDEEAAPTTVFELYELATQLARSDEKEGGDYTEILFPKVDLRVTRPKLDEIVGLSAGDAIITEALGESTFRMNEIGARAEDAAAFTAKCLGIPRTKTLVFDRPLLVWISREGLGLPLFTAWINHTDWKDPGNIFPGSSGGQQGRASTSTSGWNY